MTYESEKKNVQGRGRGRGRRQTGLRKTTKALVRNFVIPSKMRTGNFLNEVRNITDRANFVIVVPRRADPRDKK